MALIYSDLPNKTLLLPGEVATFLGCSDQTVYRLLNEGHIEGIRARAKAWRIFRDSVVVFIEKQKGKEYA
jgi:excisionase family DNA binding protein